MEIKSISNSQPSFNGKLGKNIQIYVNKAVKKEIYNIVKNANSETKYVNADNIKGVKELGDSILQKFSDYVAPLGKNTIFDMDSDLNSSCIRYGFTNSVASGKRIKIFHSLVFNKSDFCNEDICTPAQTNVSKLSSSSVKDLKTLDIIADELYKIPAQKIDKLLYTSAQRSLKEKALKSTGFISKFIVRRWAKALDKFAEELGIDYTNRIRTEEYIKIAKKIKEQNKSDKLLQKKVIKENKKILDEILKG